MDGEINRIYEYTLSLRNTRNPEELNKLNLNSGLGMAASKTEVVESWVVWPVPVTFAFGCLRQDDHECL